MDDLSLYVLNTSAKPITLEVQPANGSPVTVHVKATWIPQDLSIYALASEIRQSPNFRRGQQDKVVREVTPKEYHEIMSKKGAKEELVRISNYVPDTFSTAEEVITENDTDMADEATFNNLISSGVEASIINALNTMHTINSEAITPLVLQKLLDHASKNDMSNLVGTLEDYV